MPHTQRQQVGSRGQCTPLLLHLLLLLSVLCLSLQPCQAAIHIPSNYNISDLKEPPVITNHPVSVTLFHLEDVGLSCEATGNPPPSFRWTKDGEEFDPSLDPELKVFEGSGSFSSDLGASGIGTGPLKKYQGKYICYASNELGTAISNEVILNTDSAPALPKSEKNVKKKAEEGESMVLKCNPPPSSMDPIIHWMDWRLHHIQLSDRVMLGKDGNLYFAHLTIADSRSDYTCNIQYLLTRQVLPKQPISLSVTASNSAVRNRRPQMMRPTGLHSTYSALRGQSLELECIVQGHPTPTVSWLRKDDQMSESRITREMHDRRLHFTNISESDGGEYQCTAVNTQGKVTHTYTVIVEAAPYWTKKPESELYAPGETVKLDCQADGTPSPTISWSMNGTPLPEIDMDPRRSVTSAGALILRDVLFSDTAIYQCKASNKHGTILANTNVYVIELEPQILSHDGQLYKAAEGQKAVLNCQTFGSPKPKVTWLSDSDSSLMVDPRVNPLANGALQITNVSHDDSGLYTCSILHTNLSISAVLEVLNRTVIISPPQALNVLPGETAIFTCLAVVDPKLPTPTMVWRKNLQKIFQSHEDDKYTMKGPDLIVTNAEPEDEGIYTCEVITELDEASASGSLTLVDRPDPPGLLHISDHKHRAVTLSWTPGDDHNSPVIEYVVYFEDQGTKHGGWEELKRVGGNKASTNLPLMPYMSYRFRVIAANDVGTSEPSKPSDIHNTPAEAPDNNPEDVRSESTDPDSLVITWEELDRRNFNGPDFRYKVLWRRVMGSGPTWHVNHTTAPPFVVTDVGNYSAFEIKVQAINEKGEGPEPDPVIGYSGEDDPQEAPMNVGMALLNATAIRVTWAPVDKETVRGLLLGYKIHLTRFGPRGHHRGRRSREPESTRVIETGPNEGGRLISGLKPYSHYALSVTVFNSKGEGPPSEPLPFNTAEGAPAPPMSLELESPGEEEITVRWSPPAEPNGILIGYQLKFMVVDSDDNIMQVVNISDPTSTHHTVPGLDPNSRYRFYLSGRTAAGDGEPIVREGATILEGAPPDNFGLSVGETSVNFSWVTNERHRNLVFQIHYLNKKGNGKWKQSEIVNSSQAFYELKGLSPGSNYQLRFIHSGNRFWETDITTTGTGVMESTSFATEGWFIGLVSAIVLLLLILLILCFIKRSKGGKYSVKDKEEGPTDSEARPMKDETFGEYRSLESDNEEKNTASQASLCDGSKLCSEDTLEFLGSSAITTELNIDESLVSQYSRPSDGLPDSSPLNPTTAVSPPTNNGLPNSVPILD